METKVLALAPLCFFLSACNSSSDSVTEDPVVLNNRDVSVIELPRVLRTVSNLDPERLDLTVTVNEEVYELERDEADGRWRGVVNVPENQTATVLVQWSSQYRVNNESVKLVLAEDRQFPFVTEQRDTVTFSGNYETDFDYDNDSRTNLAEIKQGRSPIDRADVDINPDGTFDTVKGIEYPRSEVCGEKKPIAIETVPPASREVGAPGTDHVAWWCAVVKNQLTDADGVVQQLRNLEITVNVKDDFLYTDSVPENSHQDDSIEIFIDGDGNRLGPYDGQNDYQFRFTPIGTGISSMRIGPQPGPQNVSGTFTYFTGGYELKAVIPLDEVDIIWRPFGLNIEVNDDDDGLGRDAKYSWVGASGSDIAWENTKAFGAARVP